MKIKEAAAVCGLTEKAIRLYESKGLIAPETEEKNGRIYREYGDDSIRMLKTISILRRADFSMEQIGEMKDSPEKIPEIFQSYREKIGADSEKLTILRAASEKMLLETQTDINEFADHFAALIDEAENPQNVNEVPEKSDSWDEEVTGIAALWMVIPPKIRKAVMICVPSLLFLLFALNCLCMTTPVTLTEEGVLYNRESGEVTPITVTFDGELKRFLWRDDYFTGKLEIEGFLVYRDLIADSPIRTGDELGRFYDRLKIYYEDFFADAECWNYGRNTNSLIKYQNDSFRVNFMMLHIDEIENTEKFSLICPVLELYDNKNGGNWSSDTGYYLVFPAETQDDAEFLVRRMWDMYNEEYPSDMPIDE